MNDIKQDAETRMKKAVDALKNEFHKVRTGRATPSLLDHVMVDYYGNETAINQVANVSVGDARTLIVTPWEANLIPAIEKAILTSDLGLNPSTFGKAIRVPMPALNEERRKEMIKIVRSETEQARVSVRNIRRDALSQLKELLKSKVITEDDERKAIEFIQKLTDKYVAEMDNSLSDKEKDLMAV